MAAQTQPDPYADPKGWRVWAMAQPEAWKLDTLHPDLKDKVVGILADLRDLGYDAQINYGWRHPETQLSLYQEGHSTSKWSYHNYIDQVPGLGWTAAALAADIYLADAEDDADRAEFYKDLRALAVAAGLGSGANYSDAGGPSGAVARWRLYGLGWDPPHVEVILSADERAAARERVINEIGALADAQELIWAVLFEGVPAP